MLSSQLNSLPGLKRQVFKTEWKFNVLFLQNRHWYSDNPLFLVSALMDEGMYPSTQCSSYTFHLKPLFFYISLHCPLFSFSLIACQGLECQNALARKIFQLHRTRAAVLFWCIACYLFQRRKVFFNLQAKPGTESVGLKPQLLKDDVPKLCMCHECWGAVATFGSAASCHSARCG